MAETTTKALHLESLEIENFRTFRHLRIEKLGRVNLITGRNNTGKTALLEALHVYAQGGDLDVVSDVVIERDERDFVENTHNRSGSIEHDDEAAFRLNSQIIHQPQNGDDTDADIAEPHTMECRIGAIDDADAVLITLVEREQHPEHPEQKCASVFVSARGLDTAKAARLWDNIAPADEDVIAALNIIAPEVNGFSFIGQSERFPVVTTTDRRRLPLRSLGEGMHRMLGIALALVNARDGFLLIDEIESGLHYSVQKAMWRMIFQTAHRLNVQVFATTHSWDCIDAFQTVACADEESEGLLISLRRKQDAPGHAVGEVVPILFDEADLEVVTQEQIEIR